VFTQHSFFVEEQLKEYNERFQRVRIMEDLYIENYEDPGLTDTVSPGRISDVDIHNIVTKATLSGESRNFTISWTATGDDKSIGRGKCQMICSFTHQCTFKACYDKITL
jgi:hypothetical protein